MCGGDKGSVSLCGCMCVYNDGVFLNPSIPIEQREKKKRKKKNKQTEKSQIDSQTNRQRL